MLPVIYENTKTVNTTSHPLEQTLTKGKKLIKISFGKDVEKLELLCLIGGIY